MVAEDSEHSGVTLIVKAPNQLVADQVIHAEPGWTIARLKGHLSEVYPSNPKYEEQKLIYSGRLLADDIVLKDVLRKYEGQDTHTVHLVCTPQSAKYKSSPAPKTTAPAPSSSQQRSENVANSDGVRHRNVPQTPTTINHQPDANNTSQSNVYGFNPHYLNQDQIAAWTNYFNQWANVNTNQHFGNVDPMMYAAQMAWMHQMQQYFNAVQQQHAFAANQQINASNVENNANNQNVQENNANLVQQVRQEPPNVNNENGEEENQDWVDWFYNFSRWLLMISILYFYSNPIRFFTVLILGTTIYFFHEARNERRRNIIIDNINNNYQPQGAANNNNNDQVENVQRADGENHVNQDQNQQNRTANNNEADNEDSLLSITWTAFTSFFSSLIPEVPNARN